MTVQGNTGWLLDSKTTQLDERTAVGKNVEWKNFSLKRYLWMMLWHRWETFHSGPTSFSFLLGLLVQELSGGYAIEV